MDTARRELLALVAWPIVAAALALQLRVGYLGSIVLFFGVPAAFLTWRDPAAGKKAGLFAAVLAVPGTLIIDGLMHATEAYVIHSTVFPVRVFGLFPVESFLWGFLAVYFPVIFYERFLAHHVTDDLWEPRMHRLVPLMLAATIAGTAIFMVSTRFTIPHIYLILGIGLGVLPVAVEALAWPATARRIAEAGAYFFMVTVLYELTALRLGIWEFRGTRTSFLGWVDLAGTRLPVEEAVFWFVFFSMAMLVYYDRWDDYQHH